MKENQSVLDDHKLQYEDPYPKHVNINPTRPRRFGKIGRPIKSFFVNIKLACKELVDTIM